MMQFFFHENSPLLLGLFKAQEWSWVFVTSKSLFFLSNIFSVK